MADLKFENQYDGVVAGIDEVGRGPWAGPVVSAAVIIDECNLPSELGAIIDDSKKLSVSKREDIASRLKKCAQIGIGAATPEEIDDLNILRATFLSMERALNDLPVRPDFALVDGNREPALPCPCQTIVKGDSISLSIAAASIVAKVWRDNIMKKLSLSYPGYGWERNAGYGTAQHSKALDELGVTPHHRKSFAPIIKILSPD
ncbi:MAG: ribonuclease HII [Rhodospirillaceae bacterium]|nr:ribonuclease HII [Rhodospirillaceae bacterium]|tara:strand:- start:14884 stop:15492 length:609 start_codon:yes stop_codon:yes gene_type:complete